MIALRKASKTVAIILCLLMVLTLTAACGKSAGPEPKGSDTTGSTPAATPEASEQKEEATEEPEEVTFDFGGAPIRIAANWDDSPNPDTPSGQKRLELQKAAEAKYNCKVQYIALANEEFEEKMVTSIMSGDPVAEMFCMGSPAVVPRLVKEGLFLALEDIDIIPHEKKIPIEDFKKVAGYKDKTYGFDVALSVDKIGVYYNRKLLADNGYPDPHEWVYSKEWTWDKFREVAIDLTKDLDGDGNTDQWGIMTYAGDWVWFMILAYGGRIYDVENGKQMLDDPKAIACMDFIYKLFNEDKVVKPGGWAFMNDFPTGNIAFCPSFSWYGGTIKGSQLGDQYGFLPMPLGPGQTEYINPARQTTCFFMAKGTKNPEYVLNVWKDIRIWEQERPSEYNLAMYVNDDDIAIAEMLEDGIVNYDYFAGIHGDGMFTGGVIDEVGNALASGEMTGAQAAQTFGPKLQARIDALKDE